MTEHLIPIVPLAFYGTVMLLALVELLCPWRAPSTDLGRRWLTNIGLWAGNQAILWLVLPLTVLAVAQTAHDQGVGLLRVAPLPEVLAVGLGILILDLVKYAEHRLSHALPILWRLHRVHHSDVDVDFTTAQRHHPLESLLGGLVMLAVVYAFGVPPLAVVLYILAAGSVALISHANLRLPEGVDRAARLLLVTPTTHGVHHSAQRHETDSNFGLVSTLWDRLFGTYRSPQPQEDRTRVLGLEYFRSAHDARLDRVLVQPFLAAASHPVQASGVDAAAPKQRLAG